ncbi:RluA family pseudouridine synthase [Bacillus sp. DTU_2020_1000418_1_SI_GHA_SEK_038]|uniref:RluA family pseudouridine synthase n=1 Tax=Bacillus sp. DTU_2020_1000418_1_SI_GHA_SEK_038 TaxID=3077585 RepID=UPI0028EEB05B|nr:RluA family pseudouridine synthase [Bacillus sp. DTU_2020_1000418_1_SI_GHA_SEK_038]WNS76884.1 RluA family pseudouridine synthase [Bacillus sp. DTU_2020_1000418_1_SI_GHA_SEK_038]
MSRFELMWHITSEDENKNIKDFLYEKEISKTSLTDIKFKGGFISVNGKEATVRYSLKEGDSLIIGFPEEIPSDGVRGEKLPLNILYEDDYLLAVNKPAGMSTIPSREHPTGSLANALIGYYQQIGLKATTHIVTRLDRDTSGIVLVAKHRHIHHLFSKQQKAAMIHREYEALAEGVLTEEYGVIKQPIARKKDSIIEREVSAKGQYACTHYEVIRKYRSFTHVKLRLETGRTHQIRVHMSYLGHPLLGDDLYGGKLDLLSHQALHCSKLSFVHPITEEMLTFNQELPDDLRKILKKEGDC